MPEHRIRRLYSTGTSQVADKTDTFTSDLESGFTVTCPTGSTTHIVVAIDKDDLQCCQFQATASVVMKTNEVTSPGNTITLPANTPLIYGLNVNTNPFTSDVTTGFFIVNASGAAAIVKGNWLTDVTP